MSVNFWWKSLNRLHSGHTFSNTFGISKSRFLVEEIAQKFIFKMSLEITFMEFGYTLLRKGHCYSVFFKTLVLSRFLFAWNRTKFCMQYIYFKRWHWHKFCGSSLLVTNFPEFFGQLRSWFILNEIAQKKLCARYILLETAMPQFRFV